MTVGVGGKTAEQALAGLTNMTFVESGAAA